MEMFISFTGKLKSTCFKIFSISSPFRSRQFTGITGVPYFSDIEAHSSAVLLLLGSTQLSSTTKGLFMDLSSLITLCSDSSYSLLGISEMLPSVVITRPMVLCSVMTFLVPTSAAMLNGTSSENHGVITIRGASFSMYPIELGTIYPTQSIRRTLNLAFSPTTTSAASSGMNLGSVVIMVFPAADWGSSSTARSLRKSLSILGMTSCSMNRFINVDLPVRTGPTIPI